MRMMMAMLGLLAVAFAVVAQGPDYIPIAAARTQAQGSAVTVMGAVTVP